MPCLLALIALAFPRLVLVALAIFSNYLADAYQTLVWPILGFLFMPFTTLAYAWAWHATSGSVSGFPLFVVILAVLMDLGTVGGGYSKRTVIIRRSRRV